MLRRNILFSALFLIVFPSLGRADWIWTPETGKFINPQWEVKSTPADQLEFAQSFRDQGNCKKAIVEYKKLLNTYPRSKEAPEAEFYTGQCLEKMDKPYEAYKAYQMVIDKYPFSNRSAQIVTLEYNIANHLLENKGRSKWAQAVMGSDQRVIEILNTVVKDAPYGKYAALSEYKIGLYYKERGDYQNARDEFEKTMDDYPNSEWAQAAKFQIAMADSSRASDAQHEQKVSSIALDEFKQFVKTHPDSELDPEAKKQMALLRNKEAKNDFIIAQFYQKQRQLEAARIYYKEVVDHYPDTPWAFKALAILKTIGG
ncbi:MAG: outer membrane protein assembly factor BamD [Candidatus Omnitrophica bacterium]|nr:outer membrane protein assembly factor BamD [Candidatus Omnitrophota bacterium]MDE2009924.1 outer membrane protein assembly factor BamD [Candidatus Omnitrophota bacterium]MDE2232184.1 outer membrane protein assembly factor BamD [Candidatus Omnitrophota bacterium]